MHAPDDLYLKVRAGLVTKGTNLHRWCRDNGVSRQAAEKVLKGQRNGKKSKALRDRLIVAADINQ